MHLLITGGTGTFGQAFVRRVLDDPAVTRVRVLSRDELKQAEMAERFRPVDPHGKLRFLLGDVRDRNRLLLAFQDVELVVHAAALKRVDAVAYDPEEVVKTNVLGTMNVLDAAIRACVSRVVVISSDKAVMPTNIYGASKFMAESYAISANVYGAPRGVRSCAVRYGNVLGSRGSVVHRWRRQWSAGDPLTLTDPRCTRFIMPLETAVDLVLDAARTMEGGEVFVPQLRAAHLMDLAIAVAGPYWPRHVVGLRPGGEKIHETLLSPEESVRTVARQGVYLLRPALHPWRATFDAGRPGGDGGAWPPTSWRRLEDGFLYTSESAPKASVEELRDLLAKVPDA
jgi:UDP-N-acetylglucosamine 4,6-dehydratase